MRCELSSLKLSLKLLDSELARKLLATYSRKKGSLVAEKIRYSVGSLCSLALLLVSNGKRYGTDNLFTMLEVAQPKDRKRSLKEIHFKEENIHTGRLYSSIVPPFLLPYNTSSASNNGKEHAYGHTASARLRPWTQHPQSHLQGHRNGSMNMGCKKSRQPKERTSSTS